MKEGLPRINTAPWYLRVIQWGRLITITGFAQALIQVVGFACGILVIRLLPTHEYAVYILANTLVGTMTVLADGGISTGVTAQGGQVWRDREKLGVILVTGMNLRKKFATASLTVAIPLLIILLINHDTSWLTIILIILTVIPAFLSTLSSSLLQIAPKLQQDILPLQKNQVSSNLFRLFLTASLLTFIPFAFIAILATSLPQVWANRKLKKISEGYADWSQNENTSVRDEILKYVKRILPGSIYYCVSGQISIWLISIFGSTSAIAQVGALTRLAMVLTLFSTVVNMLVVPRFARLPEKRSVLFDYYVKVQLSLFLFSVIFVSAVYVMPEEILWVLGENYSGLNYELLLVTLASCLNLAVGINYILNSSRGWLLHPVIGIAVGIGGIIGGVSIFDVSTLRGVLLFNIFTGVVGMFIHPLFGFVKMSRLKVRV